MTTTTNAPQPLEQPSPLWGIGQYLDASTRRVAWEISEAEIHRDIGRAAEVLGRLGVGPGARVLVCSMVSEAGQFFPYSIGPMMLGAQVSLSDATPAEATRVRMFTNLLDYHMAFGVNAALLDGLAELDADLVEVFGAIPVVVARDDAYDRLAAAGLTPYRLALVGPAVAVGFETGGPAEVAAAEWHLDATADGHVAVTALAARATHFDHTPTAITGRVLDSSHLIPGAA